MNRVILICQPHKKLTQEIISITAADDVQCMKGMSFMRFLESEPAVPKPAEFDEWLCEAGEARRFLWRVGGCRNVFSCAARVCAIPRHDS